MKPSDESDSYSDEAKELLDHIAKRSISEEDASVILTVVETIDWARSFLQNKQPSLKQFHEAFKTKTKNIKKFLDTKKKND